jgi:hypothetical protein
VSSFSQDWIGYRADNHSYYQSTEKSLHCPENSYTPFLKDESLCIFFVPSRVFFLIYVSFFYYSSAASAKLDYFCLSQQADGLEIKSKCID